MNWALGIVAILLAVAILRQSEKPQQPEFKAPDLDPRSILDHLEVLRAGGAAQEAGPTINPTGQATTMITYDKL